MPRPLGEAVGKAFLRSYEAFVATRGRRAHSSRAASGVPIPPPGMRVKVVGHADADAFLDQGRRHNEAVRAALSRAGAELGEVEALLDWGCGCGRVMRWWADLPPTEIHGCDYNAKLVRWVNGNLGFAEARANGLRPPLPYGAGAFDLAYAISIFTHLSDELAVAWIGEIHRVLRPGGLFFFTTHGRAYRDRLRPQDSDRFDRGESVVLLPTAVGSNLCASYYPVEWVREHLLGGFELVELREAHRLPPDELDGLLQDRWLIRKVS